MLLSLQIGFSFVRAASACSEVLEAGYGTQLLPFAFDLPLDVIGTVYHQFIFFQH